MQNASEIRFSRHERKEREIMILTSLRTCVCSFPTHVEPGLKVVIFSRGLATLELAMSVCRSVGNENKI